MPKSYTYLCEQETNYASEYRAQHCLPCFGGLGLLSVLPCEKLGKTGVYVFKLAVYFRIADKLLTLPVVEIIVELL